MVAAESRRATEAPHQSQLARVICIAAGMLAVLGIAFLSRPRVVAIADAWAGRMVGPLPHGFAAPLEPVSRSPIDGSPAAAATIFLVKPSLPATSSAAVPSATGTPPRTATGTSSSPPTRHAPQPSPGPGARRVFAVFSTDTVDFQYASLAPLSAYVWVHLLGVTPLVFFTGTPNATQQHVERAVVGAIERYGGMVERISPRQGYLTATTLQNVRLAAMYHAVLRPDDYLITSDADDWPISPSFWKPVLAQREDRMWIYNGPFYYEGPPPRGIDFAAISFLGAPVRHWRTLHSKWCRKLGLAESHDVMQTLWQIIDAGERHFGAARWAAHDSKHGVQWRWDQMVASTWLLDECPANCTINPKISRLDRSHNIEWDGGGRSDYDTVREFTDAHLLYPLTDDHAYRAIKRVWLALFNSSEVIDAFRQELIEAVKLDGKRS